MKQRGYLLIELMIAGVLVSAVGSGLSAGLIQGLKAEKRIRTVSENYGPAQIFMMRLEKDLRNAINLTDYPFSGKSGRINFPVLILEEKENKKKYGIVEVGYWMRNNTLIRAEREVKPGHMKGKMLEKVVLNNVHKIVFSFSFLDEEERILYESFWIESPYFGIPKAVKFELVTTKGLEFKGVVVIPQGRWGHLQDEKREPVNNE